MQMPVRQLNAPPLRASAAPRLCLDLSH